MDAFVGEIRAFAFNFTPVYWMRCWGGTVPLNQYQALAAVIGTMYGGDGKTTIGIPDLRGRVLLNSNATTGNNVASTGGVETVLLNQTQIPAHFHTAGAVRRTVTGTLSVATNTPSASTYITNNVVASANTTILSFSNLAADTTMHPLTIGATPANPAVAHPNMGPYLPMNYCICVYGEFPVRD